MNVEDIQQYMRQLLTALNRVHQKNVIHRDVKPNNFLFDLESQEYVDLRVILVKRNLIHALSSNLDTVNHPWFWSPLLYLEITDFAVKTVSLQVYGCSKRSKHLRVLFCI